MLTFYLSEYLRLYRPIAIFAVQWCAVSPQLRISIEQWLAATMPVLDRKVNTILAKRTTICGMKQFFANNESQSAIRDFVRVVGVASAAFSGQKCFG